MELGRGIPVRIQLRTEVAQGGEKETFLIDEEGRFLEMGQSLYLKYMEPGAVTGDEKIPVVIKIEPDGELQIIRSGNNRMRLKFAYQKKYATSYRTEMGILPIQTYTEKMHVSLKQETVFVGKIDLQYTLYAHAEKLGDYQLQLKFTEI